MSGLARVDVKLSVVVPVDRAAYVVDWLYEGLSSQLCDYLDLGAEARTVELVAKKAKK